MLIDLLTIDKNGRIYDFDEFSSEISGAFVDLIGQEPFKIQITISLLAEAYKISGKLSSRSQDICSLCGYEFHYPLENSINEIVIIEKQRPRNTQVSQSSINFDLKQPSVTYINKSQFDLKEFLHEIMASSLKPFPVCGDFKICQSRRFRLERKDERMSSGHPGFSLLKKFKVRC